MAYEPRVTAAEKRAEAEPEHRAAGVAYEPSASQHQRNGLVSVVKELGAEVGQLLQNEVALAKREMTDRMQGMVAGGVTAIAGMLLAMAALVILLQSAVYALANYVEPGWAALIVAVVTLLIAYLFVRAGQRKLSAAQLTPQKTIDSVRKDVRTGKEAMR